MGKGFFAIWAGRHTGVYAGWAACRVQTDGFRGARFRGFATEAEARAAYEGGPPAPGATTVPKPMATPPAGEPVAIAVDAACKGTEGRADNVGECRCVVLPPGRELWRRGPWGYATNNVMEYIAVVEGLRWLTEHGASWPLYSDSATALCWARGPGGGAPGRCRTTHPPPPGTELHMRIKTADDWLARAGAAPLALLRKWDTRTWGEIPADYGRKH